MRPLLKETLMLQVSENVKSSFFQKSNVVALVRVTNDWSHKNSISPVNLNFEFTSEFKFPNVMLLLYCYNYKINDLCFDQGISTMLLVFSCNVAIPQAGTLLIQQYKPTFLPLLCCAIFNFCFL